MSSRSRKSRRKLNSLFMVLLLTGMLLLASTYAWFSANRVVELNGINAKVSAAEGLQISLDGKTWQSKITINEAALAAVKDDNAYQWPSELVPVSTIGTTTDGKLDLYHGSIENDGADLNGTEKETDPITGISNSGKYIVFDLYFKNASSKDADTLQFTADSSIAISSADNGGVQNTGLENCMRAAVVLWEGKAAMTADQATVKGITSGTPKVCIWEPNYLNHITEVKTNDTRVASESASAPFKTLGIIAPGNLTGVNAASAKEGVMSIQNTLTTSGGTMGNITNMPNLGSETDLLKLDGNSIKKARIYIWIEGQDPDCIDTASTGKSIDVKLGFTKPGADAATP